MRGRTAETRGPLHRHGEKLPLLFAMHLKIPPPKLAGQAPRRIGGKLTIRYLIIAGRDGGLRGQNHGY